MSEAIAITNVIGNGVATVVVTFWDGELDRDKLRWEFSLKGDLGIVASRIDCGKICLNTLNILRLSTGGGSLKSKGLTKDPGYR